MTHGYKCDSCGTFVEQERQFEERHPDISGPIELVRVDNPQLQSSDGFDIEEYTLCEDCRTMVINVIESDIPVGLLNIQDASPDQLEEIKERMGE